MAAQPLEGNRLTADLVFRRERVAVFVDGCFWHGCPMHKKVPATNVEYWTKKMARNRQRDSRIDEDLRRAGWTVIRIWEHEPVAQAANEVLTAILGASGCPIVARHS